MSCICNEYLCLVPTTESLLPSLKPVSEKAVAMTVDEIVEWLQDNKFGEFADKFKEDDVDGETLAAYDVADLVDIKVPRRKAKQILLKFRRIK